MHFKGRGGYQSIMAGGRHGGESVGSMWLLVHISVDQETEMGFGLHFSATHF